MGRLETAEAERLTRSDCLREVENALRQADSLLREAEKELSHKREALIRSEALYERYQSEQDSLIERIRDKLDCAPEQPLSSHQKPAQNPTVYTGPIGTRAPTRT